MLTLSKLNHPYYKSCIDDWNLWRLAYEGGTAFRDRYLEHYSDKETKPAFEKRRKITPPTTFAKSAINDIVNNIFQRMSSIVRSGGSSSYQEAIIGRNRGVDLLDSSMNYFMGKKVLPELLTMKRVGIYVDMPEVNEPNLYDVKTKNIRPYLYLYTSEEIQNWECTSCGDYTKLVLKETYNARDETYDLPVGLAERWRYLYLNEDGKVVQEYQDGDGKVLEQKVLTLDRIPFLIVEIPESLLKDAAHYQVTLLNMESSDINYCLRANFPFYVEYEDPRQSNMFARQGVDEQGQSVSSKDIPMGPTTGRTYIEQAPSFIHPSSEPLQASMAKEEALKKDIRQLINLAVSNLNPDKQISAESKKLETAGLEAGLSFIGIELEKAERKIGVLWSMYEKVLEPTVNYPDRYDLKTDEERRDGADAYMTLMPKFPSKTCQVEIAKMAARELVMSKVSRETMLKIEKELEDAPILCSDPEILRLNVEAGFLDCQGAADASLYPVGTAEKANKERADRLAEIAASQASASQARGVPDAGADPNAGSKEKKLAKDNTGKADPSSAVRGDGK